MVQGSTRVQGSTGTRDVGTGEHGYKGRGYRGARVQGRRVQGSTGTRDVGTGEHGYKGRGYRGARVQGRLVQGSMGTRDVGTGEHGYKGGGYRGACVQGTWIRALVLPPEAPHPHTPPLRHLWYTRPPTGTYLECKGLNYEKLVYGLFFSSVLGLQAIRILAGLQGSPSPSMIKHIEVHVGAILVLVPVVSFCLSLMVVLLIWSTLRRQSPSRLIEDLTYDCCKKICWATVLFWRCICAFCEALYLCSIFLLQKTVALVWSCCCTFYYVFFFCIMSPFRLCRRKPPAKIGPCKLYLRRYIAEKSRHEKQFDFAFELGWDAPKGLDVKEAKLLTYHLTVSPFSSEGDNDGIVRYKTRERHYRYQGARAGRYRVRLAASTGKQQGEEATRDFDFQLPRLLFLLHTTPPALLQSPSDLQSVADALSDLSELASKPLEGVEIPWELVACALSPCGPTPRRRDGLLCLQVCQALVRLCQVCQPLARQVARQRKLLDTLVLLAADLERLELPPAPSQGSPTIPPTPPQSSKSTITTPSPSPPPPPPSSSSSSSSSSTTTTTTTTSAAAAAFSSKEVVDAGLLADALWTALVALVHALLQDPDAGCALSREGGACLLVELAEARPADPRALQALSTLHKQYWSAVHLHDREIVLRFLCLLQRQASSEEHLRASAHFEHLQTLLSDPFGSLHSPGGECDKESEVCARWRRARSPGNEYATPSTLQPRSSILVNPRSPDLVRVRSI
eukprot:g60373.t1